jgi:AcrR family transcriptional regulator
MRIAPNWKSGSVYSPAKIRNRASDFKVGYLHFSVMAADPKTDERPLRADARRNRERILQAARGACAEHGASVQIDDVARSAGVGVGTVYRHFPTKDALIAALVAEKFRLTSENLRQALEIEDPWEAFAEGLRRNAEVMAADAGLRDALIRLGPDLRHDDEGRAELDELAGRLVARAQAAGALRDDVTVQDIGALLGGLCTSMAHPGLDWRRHLELLLDGLRARR